MLRSLTTEGFANPKSEFEPGPAPIVQWYCGDIEGKGTYQRTDGVLRMHRVEQAECSLLIREDFATAHRAKSAPVTLTVTRSGPHRCRAPSIP